MKKSIVFIVFVLTLSLVEAGKISYLGELNKTETITLQVGNGFYFDYLGKQHLAILRQVNDNNIRMSVFPANETMTGTTFPISPKVFLKVDLDKDKKRDIQVEVFDWNKELQIATIKLTPIPQQNRTITETLENESFPIITSKEKDSTITGFLIMAGIIAGGLLIFYFFRSFRSQSRDKKR